MFLRSYLYSLLHDKLWNVLQLDMVPWCIGRFVKLFFRRAGNSAGNGLTSWGSFSAKLNKCRWTLPWVHVLSLFGELRRRWF